MSWFPDIGVRPYFEDDDVVIFLADCREILPLLEPGRVDLVLTDPPYGIGYDYGTTYDDGSEGYIDMLWPIVESSEAALRETGLFCLFQAVNTMAKWGEWFPRHWKPFALPKTFAQMNRGLITQSCDYAIYWPMANAPRKPPDWQHIPNRNWFVSSGVSTTNGQGRMKRPNHPCPRPLDTMLYLIACLCPPIGIILDPFLGSGTTARAAKDLGRKCIGIEMEEKYCEIAAKRMAQTVMQL